MKLNIACYSKKNYSEEYASKNYSQEYTPALPENIDNMTNNELSDFYNNYWKEFAKFVNKTSGETKFDEKTEEL